jgi:hypothetical protein
MRTSLRQVLPRHRLMISRALSCICPEVGFDLTGRLAGERSGNRSALDSLLSLPKPKVGFDHE